MRGYHDEFSNILVIFDFFSALSLVLIATLAIYDTSRNEPFFNPFLSFISSAFNDVLNGHLEKQSERERLLCYIQMKVC